MLNLHGISRESFDLIVSFEVSSEAAYNKQYRRPERPGGESGITVGIGYDCGYVTGAEIRRDWGGKIAAGMVTALVGVAGLKGASAQKVLASVRPKVDVPWAVAIDVFSNVSIPKYMAMARNGLPGFDDLTPDCKGALLSLVYNRGASFRNSGARYSEMRAIRADMLSGDLADIPVQLRKMKRLWTTASVRGVALRRDQEARLFERGLKASSSRALAEPETPEEEPQDPPAEAAAPIPVSDAVPVAGDVSGDPELFSVKKRLRAMNYNPGVQNGVWGGMTAGAIAGFINDRPGLTMLAPTSIETFYDILDDLKAELGEAESETPPFTRPVTEARKTGDAATVAEVAPEVVPVKQNFLLSAWTAVMTFLYGVYTTVSDYVSQAWDFFTDNKDSLPSDSGFLHTAWGWVSSLPPIVWILVLAGLFGFIAINSRAAGNKITESVSTGARQ